MTFFYDLNKKLDEIRATPSTTHGQLNERDMGKHNNGKTTGFKAVADKAAKEYGSKAAGERVAGAVKAKMAKSGKLEEQEVDEGMDQLVQRIGGIARKAKKLTGNALDKLTGGSDADQIRDLQKKMGLPQTGMKPGDEPNPKIVKEKMSPAKAKSFAALAEPKDKITFADKIAGAKKEVDEMLGDVAAEAMKSALSGGQKKLDKNNNGKLDANDFAMLRKGAGKQETDEGWDDMVKDVHARAGQMKPGEKTQGHKGEIEKTSTGIRHTRRYDNKTGETDTGDDSSASGEKRGRGRPKKAGGPAQERVTAKSRKADRTTFQSKKKTNEAGGMKQTFAILDDTLIDQIAAMNGAEVDPDAGSVETYDENTARQLIAFAQKNPNRLKRTQSMNTAGMSPMAQRVGGTATGPEYGLKEEGGDLKAAMALLKKAGYKVSKGEQELDEKAVSKKQQKFMGMVHATQKGEKAPSKEVAKVAKSMGKKDAEDFASTKHKGLPEKAPKKKEKTEEAGGSGTPTASSGFSYGKGIYDSFNRDLESMISESMSVNMSNSTEGGKSLTITASDEDAVKLATLLKSAGLGGGSDQGYGGSGYQSACGCGTPDCSCGDSEVDEAYGDTQPTENQPNWPTNQEGAQDNFEYSGGLNKPKSTGQTTTPVIASQDERQGTYAEAEEDAIKRMMEMAGIKTEAKKPDFLDVDKDGDKTEPFKKAVDDKKEKKVDEGILSATANLWSEYKGQYGV